MLKDFLLKLEATLKPKLEFIKWLNKETPLVFLLFLWGITFITVIFVLILTLTGHITEDQFNIYLSLLALITTGILTIVVVL